MKRGWKYAEFQINGLRVAVGVNGNTMRVRSADADTFIEVQMIDAIPGENADSEPYLFPESRKIRTRKKDG